MFPAPTIVTFDIANTPRLDAPADVPTLGERSLSSGVSRWGGRTPRPDGPGIATLHPLVPFTDLLEGQRLDTRLDRAVLDELQNSCEVIGGAGDRAVQLDLAEDEVLDVEGHRAG
jgi:hypothetical protein